MKDDKLPKGRVWPLGASCHDGGVNFALFSSGARSVTLCVFDTDGHETHRYAMNGPVNNVWHGFLPDAGTGLIYGYRVDGPYDPSRGLRYNPARLLLDPYARRLHGQFQWHESHLDRPDTQMDDNAAYMPKAVVTGVHEFAWEGAKASSTKRTSRASPNPTPTCRPSCAAPMKAWPARPPLPT